ncbi:hypothetical protein MGALJ_24110 [Mycobacterium gallinarum]|uniref:DUF2505 domain-containing protein n=1 Tax=Mycobacterium gallinarum TaxID=39689 RepID=A0A9W4FF30_9MYCO|nr:DUF2505 domain-containing protein [Mycobacterium gallinarum]BBY92742.1 hypothetical protein MGALJ_24110 [Mycobacterium gallinarum]
MPRSVDFCVKSPASVEQIHSAFSDENYWQTRLAEFGGFGTLDSLVIDSDRAATVVIIQKLRHEGLPKIVARFFPRDWKVVQKETWRPIGDGLVRGEIDIASHGAPGSGSGVALLAPTESGSRLDCNATVEFRVPLVGGKIESMIGHMLSQQFNIIERFTTKWITEQA